MEQERQQIKFQAVLNSQVMCDTCRRPLSRQRMLIIWNEDREGVTALKLVHQVNCDDKNLRSSSGAAYGHDWPVEREVTRFSKKKFKNREDENKLFHALNLIEMGECHE